MSMLWLLVLVLGAVAEDEVGAVGVAAVVIGTGPARRAKTDLADSRAGVLLLLPIGLVMTLPTFEKGDLFAKI